MSSLIIRSELISLLSRSKKYPITLVVAPAGFGKTTLLDQWQDGNPYALVARLNLQDSEHDLLKLMNAMLREIRKVTEVFDAPIVNLSGDRSDVDDSVIIDAVVQVLKSINETIYLVIDDFKISDGNASQVLLSRLVDRFPDHVHFIFSSRQYPKINFSRLKISDRLLVIDSQDLMIDEVQIAQLAVEVCGYPLDDEYIIKLMALTEGWLAGVKIALLAIKEYGLKGLDQFSGGQSDLMDYFASEVFSSLSDGNKQFFMVSSIFKRFDNHLCDYVLERTDSNKVLKELVSQSSFILEDKENPGWYRFHSLLLTFLHEKLSESLGSKDLQALNKRAVEACLKQGQYELALFHGQKYLHGQSLIELQGKCCEYWLKQGMFSQIIESLSVIEESTLLKESKLFIAYIYALIFSRRFNQSHYFLSLLKEYAIFHDDQILDDIEFLELSLRLFQMDTESLSKDTVTKMMMSINLSETRNFSLIISAYFDLQNGRLESSFKKAYEAKTVVSETGYVFLESFSDVLIALCDRYMGRGVEAVNFITSIYAKQKYIQGGLPWVTISAGMVIVYYEQNELVKAKSLCEKLLPYLNYTCVTEVITTVYLSLSRLLFNDGDRTKALRVLDQLDRILMHGRYDRFNSQVLFELMRQSYIAKDDMRIKSLLESSELSELDAINVVIDGDYVESNERRTLALSYSMCLKGEYELASALLKVALENLEGLGMMSRILVVKSNLAIIDVLKGQKHLAISQLATLVDQHGLLSFSRTIFDEAPGLEELFIMMEKDTDFKIPPLFRRVFSDLFEGSVSGQVDLDFPLLSLTEKENLVYSLLVNGLSNAEISYELGVALSTTKWHLKNIYQKLGVSNRSEAIVKSRAVQLQIC